MFVVFCSIISTANITVNINSIHILNDSNFKLWQENILILLAVMDLDHASRVDLPLPLMDENTPDDKRKIEK